MLWTRDEIQAVANDRRNRAVERDCRDWNTLTRIMMDVAARMALDNAATLAERHGDPELESAINALKEQFRAGE